MSTLNRTFLGSHVLLAIAGVAVEAPAQALRLAFEGFPGDQAGFVTELGDLDGDGAADFAVGAPSRPNSDGYVGVVRAVSGRIGEMLWEVRGGPSAHAFGQALANAGDVDGDGVDDVLVGDPADDLSGADAGRSFVFSGADGASLWEAQGTVSLKCGFAVAGVGDVVLDNGQGDLAIGYPGVDLVRLFDPSSGIVYGWAGQAGGLFGHDVSAAGDVDGDGYGDVIIGEPWFDGSGRGEVDVGRAQVYSARSGALIFEVLGTDPDGHFGIAVDGIGDVDGDGHADVIVGAYQDDTNGVDAGKAVVYSGATGLPLYTLFGEAGTLFGLALGGIGDMDGDGVPDFGVAAPEHNDVGRVTTYSGVDGSVFHDYDHGAYPYDGEFWGLVTGADFDGDGDADLALATPAWSDQSDARGRVEIYCTSDATASSYGAGWPGTFGVPTLEGSEPAIGGPVDVAVGNSLGATTLGLLFLGLDDDFVPTNKGGTILVDPFMTVLFSVAATGTTLSDTLPDDPALCDLELFLQVIEADAGASKGLSFTPGLKLHVGYVY